MIKKSHCVCMNFPRSFSAKLLFSPTLVIPEVENRVLLGTLCHSELVGFDTTILLYQLHSC